MNGRVDFPLLEEQLAYIVKRDALGARAAFIPHQLTHLRERTQPFTRIEHGTAVQECGQ